MRPFSFENRLSVGKVVDDDINVDVDSGRIAGGISRSRWGWRKAKRLVRGKLLSSQGRATVIGEERRVAVVEGHKRRRGSGKNRFKQSNKRREMEME
jgi:hypothetical protein